MKTDLSHFIKTGAIFLSYVLFLTLTVVVSNLSKPIFGPPHDLPYNLTPLYLFGFCLFSFIIWSSLSNSKLTKQGRRRIIFLFLPAIILLAFFSKPLLSQDIYQNLLLSKAFVLEHVNPYSITPSELSNYSLYNYLHVWRDRPMMQGPLSVYYFSFPYLFSNSDIFALVILRVVATIIIFITAYLLYKIEKSSEPNAGKHYAWSLFILSPFVLLQGITDLHNDVLVMLFITLSYYLLVKGKFTFSFVSLVLGFCAKYVTVLLLPIPFICLLRSQKTVSEKLRGMLIMFLSSSAIFLVSYPPFIRDLSNITEAVGIQSALSHVAQMTPMTFFLLGPFSGNVFLLKIFGFVIGVFLACALTLKKRYLEAYIAPIVVVLGFTTTWVVGWYLLWIFPLLLLLKYRSELNIFVGLMILGTEGFSIMATTTVFALYIFYSFTLRYAEKSRKSKISVVDGK